MWQIKLLTMYAICNFRYEQIIAAESVKKNIAKIIILFLISICIVST
jgi:hypothetical protein